MSRLLPSAFLTSLIALILVVPTGGAAAASSSVRTQQVTFLNNTAVQLALATTTPYNFGPVSPLAVAAPGGNENAATVWSNGSWRLLMRAAGPNFTEVPTGTHTIPVGRLQVRGSGGQVTASTTDQQIGSGNATPQAGRNTNINYRLSLQWGDAASTAGSVYSQTIVYTAVTP